MSKTFKVKIIKIAGEKTVTGQVVSLKKHSLYQKYIKHYKKYLIHDDKSQAKVGDEVEVVETRPLSKRKRWKIVYAD